MMNEIRIGSGSLAKKQDWFQNNYKRIECCICCRFLGLLHFIWGMLLMVLIALGLLNVPWNANYIGADLTWLSVLLFAAGVLYIAQFG